MTINQAQNTTQGADGEAFEPLGVRMPFAAGEEVYAQEDEAVFVYKVLTGSVRTTRLLSDGRRQIGDFYYPGSIFGLETGKFHRFSAEALIDCTIVLVRRSAIRDGEETTARIERALWKATSQELQRTQEHLLLLGRKTACEKVASFLLDLSERFRNEVTELPMGRQDMADYLGLTMETVSRMLGQLQSDGLIELMGCRRFKVKQRAALNRLAA